MSSLNLKLVRSKTSFIIFPLKPTFPIDFLCLSSSLLPPHNSGSEVALAFFLVLSYTCEILLVLFSLLVRIIGFKRSNYIGSMNRENVIDNMYLIDYLRNWRD